MITPGVMDRAHRDAVTLVEAFAAGDRDAVAAVLAANAGDGVPLITALAALLAGLLDERGTGVAGWAAERRRNWQPPPQVPGHGLN